MNVCWQGVTCSFGSGCNLYCTLTSLGAVFPKLFATGSLLNPNLGKGNQRWGDEIFLQVVHMARCRQKTEDGEEEKLLTYLIEAQQKDIFREQTF